MTKRYTVHEDESGKFHHPTWWVEDEEEGTLYGPFDSEIATDEEAARMNEYKANNP